MVDVGLGIGRVLADHVGRGQLAALHRLEHQREVDPGRRVQRHAVGRLELAAVGVVVDVLEARQLVRQCAHVSATLDVVLPTEGDEARSPAADVTGEEREVAQCQHVVDRVVMLGDAERPEDL